MDARFATFCAALAATLGGPALGQTHWICGISSEGTRLVCVADTDPAEEPGTASRSPTATVNGTRFPLDPLRVYTVDMWSPPTEADFVMLLARSTICYRSPGCHVRVMPGPWLTAAQTTARR